MEETKETSLKDEIRALNQNFTKLIESGKVKGVKPKKIGKSQLKKGYVNYIYVKENGNMDIIKVPIQEGTTVIDETPRLATPEYVLNWKGTPTIIQPSWSTEPFSPVQSFEQTARDKMLAAGYRLLANRVELGEIKPKKKMSGALIFIIIAAVIVGGYLLLKK